MIDHSYALAKKEMTSFAVQKRILSGVSTIVFPIIISLWLLFYKEIIQVNSYLFWILLGVFVLVQLIFAIFLISGPSTTQEIYFNARDLDDQCAKLLESNQNLLQTIEYFSIYEEAANAWAVMERKYIERRFDRISDFEEPIAEIMSVVIASREKLFGFRLGELWNFALYIYDSDGNLLVPVWREKHEAHPSTSKGRSWQLGEGHVGRAFQSQQTIITADATGEAGEVLKLSNAKTQPYDSEAYRSYASVPLGPTEENAPALGVLVATSNEVGRFDKANCLILRQIACVLSNVIHFSNPNVRRRLSAERSPNEPGSGSGC